MGITKYVDADEMETITVDALEQALNALEIVNEVYVEGELDFVNEAIARVKEALNLSITEEN
jgi:hypothetical protein